ncbi:MAG: multicopper oxidase domain-containing protein [Segetibacter sp.]
MKCAITIAFLFLTVTLQAQHMPGMKVPMQKEETRKQVDKVIYTCVMHPEVKMDKSGNCPKCEMKLVKKIIKTASPKMGTDKQESMKRSTDTMPSKMDMKDMNGMDMKNDTDMNMNMPMGDKMDINPNKVYEVNQVAGKVNLSAGKTVRYELYVRDTIVNFTGKSKRAIAINGSIPAPTLTFTEGDTAEIYLHNELKKEETSLHWHGVVLPNRFDGVPYLTTARIGSGKTHLYKFAVVQNGTYWYHSHSALQEQIGMYGALIFKKREVPSLKATVRTHLFEIL